MNNIPPPQPLYRSASTYGRWEFELRHSLCENIAKAVWNSPTATQAEKDNATANMTKISYGLLNDKNVVVIFWQAIRSCTLIGE